MKVAHIVPTAHLVEFTGFSDYHVALTHLVLRDTEYAKFYKRVAAQKDSTVILDNSLWYNEKEALDWGQITMAAEMIRPQEVVFPDVFLNGEETVNKFKAALMRVKGGDVDSANPLWQRNVAVVQGNSRQELIDCFDELVALSDVHVIAFPKAMSTVWGTGGRFAACSYLYATRRVDTKKSYHLLGIQDDPLEVMLQQVFNPWIRGIDTALAFHAGLQETTLKFVAAHNSKPKRPPKYFEVTELQPIQRQIIAENFKTIGTWAEWEV